MKNNDANFGTIPSYYNGKKGAKMCATPKSDMITRYCGCLRRARVVNFETETLPNVRPRRKLHIETANDVGSDLLR